MTQKERETKQTLEGIINKYDGVTKDLYINIGLTNYKKYTVGQVQELLMCFDTIGIENTMYLINPKYPYLLIRTCRYLLLDNIIDIKNLTNMLRFYYKYGYRYIFILSIIHYVIINKKDVSISEYEIMDTMYHRFNRDIDSLCDKYYQKVKDHKFSIDEFINDLNNTKTMKYLGVL